MTPFHDYDSKGFAIDKSASPSPTILPVQVLVLGLSRTGTFCMLTVIQAYVRPY